MLWTKKGEGSLWGRVLRIPLWILSGIYGIIINARTEAYRRGLFKSRGIKAKVIVVGNLSVGGTGKTPLAAWIARRLADRDLRPVVISRGYKGAQGAEPLVVSDGSGPLLGPQEAGDEPVLLAKKLHGIPVVAGKDRVRAGELAVLRFRATHLVLDDGFQHLALERNVDVLVLDFGRDPDREYLLPRGPLREPISAAARAHAIVISRAESPEFMGWEWMERICPGVPVFPMRSRLVGLVSLDGGSIRPADMPSLAFCAIGDPAGFFESLENAGMEVMEKVIFDDHHAYTELELKGLAEKAKKCGAARMVTTEKDAVKIRPEWCRGFTVDVLRVEPDFMGAHDRFFEIILEIADKNGKAA